MSTIRAGILPAQAVHLAGIALDLVPRAVTLASLVLASSLSDWSDLLGSTSAALASMENPLGR